MVGRLVQQQDIGLRRQGAGKRAAPAFAAGQVRRVLRARQAKLFEQPVRALRLVAGLESRADIIQRRVVARQVGLLRQVAQGRAGLEEPFAVVERDLAGGDFHQCRFARPVAADQAQAVAFRYRQLRPFQQRRAAEGQVNVAQDQKGRRQDMCPGSIVMITVSDIRYGDVKRQEDIKWKSISPRSSPK